MTVGRALAFGFDCPGKELFLLCRSLFDSLFDGGLLNGRLLGNRLLDSGLLHHRLLGGWLFRRSLFLCNSHWSSPDKTCDLTRSQRVPNNQHNDDYTINPVERYSFSWIILLETIDGVVFSQHFSPSF